MGAFNSRSSIPYSDVNLKEKSGRPPSWGPDSSLAEVATIQLEFNDLSHTLNNPMFQVCYYLLFDLYSLMMENVIFNMRVYQNLLLKLFKLFFVSIL